jgi:hypothetical protein
VSAPVKFTERQGRAAVYERSGGVCEFCGVRRASSYHHRLKRSHGGTWAPSNGLHLCGDGTTGCHGQVEGTPDWAKDHGLWVPSWGDPESQPVWRHGFGWQFPTADGWISADET